MIEISTMTQEQQDTVLKAIYEWRKTQLNLMDSINQFGCIPSGDTRLNKSLENYKNNINWSTGILQTLFTLAKENGTTFSQELQNMALESDKMDVLLSIGEEALMALAHNIKQQETFLMSLLLKNNEAQNIDENVKFFENIHSKKALIVETETSFRNEFMSAYLVLNK